MAGIDEGVKHGNNIYFSLLPNILFSPIEGCDLHCARLVSTCHCQALIPPLGMPLTCPITHLLGHLNSPPVNPKACIYLATSSKHLPTHYCVPVMIIIIFNLQHFIETISLFFVSMKSLRGKHEFQ